MPALDPFVVKTHAALAELSQDAAKVRRNLHARACSDAGACVSCTKIRTIHALIDDHLYQLEEDVLRTLDFEAPDPTTCDKCGRTRYRNVTNNVTACPACEGISGIRGEWTPMDRETA